MAANLHLIVGPAEEFERPVGPAAGEVTGPVEPGSALPVERVGHEPLGRQRRSAEVTSRHPGATDVELADHADRDGLHEPIEHVEPRPRDRPSDRERARGGAVAREGVDATADDRLRRPVFVDDQRPGGVLAPEGDVLGRELLAADDERPRPPGGLVGRNLPAEQLEVRRGDLDEAVARASPDGFGERLDALVLVEQVHATADEERQEEARHRQVERDR